MGAGAYSEVVTTAPDPKHLMFNLGLRTKGMKPWDFKALQELVEWDEIYNGQVADGETVSSGAAQVISALLSNARLLFSNHSKSGREMARIVQGGDTQAFEQIVAAYGYGQELAIQGTKQSRVSGHFFVHGQGDEAIGNTNYLAQLISYQSALSQSLSTNVPVFLAQTNEWTASGTNKATPTANVPLAQLMAFRDNPTKFLGVAPLYFIPHVSDGLHLTGHGERMLGEYFGKAYARYQATGSWKPLYPTRIVWEGSSMLSILIDFNVPVAPLRFDSVTVTNPGNFGFEYWNGTTTIAITSVELASPTQVRVRLLTQGGSGNPRIRYAWRGTVGAKAGPTTGPRGCLCDSDSTPSPNGYNRGDLRNWCWAFELPVNGMV